MQRLLRNGRDDGAALRGTLIVVPVHRRLEAIDCKPKCSEEMLFTFDIGAP